MITRYLICYQSMTKILNLSATSDSTIVNRLRGGDDQALNFVYRKCRDYCINFMINSGADTEKAADLFQDAVIVFYEKVKNKDFELKSSIQTYLNSICRNQWLTHLRDNKEVFVKDLETFEYLNNLTDWFDEYEDERQSRINKITAALQQMEAAGGNCKELLLLFFYEKKNMEEIAAHFGYTNADNAKAQKYKCQERLKKMVNA